MNRRPVGVGGRLLAAAVIAGLGITGGTLIVDGHVAAFVWGFIAIVLIMSVLGIISDGKKR